LGSGRRWLQLAVGVGLSALFLYIAVRGVEWGEVRASLAHADYRYLPVLIAVGVYVLYVRSQRWRLLLRQATGRQLPMRPVFSANAIGFMGNMLLPLRAGEIARPLLLAGGTGIPVPTVLATVVVERILDLLALVCFAIWVVSGANVPPEVVAAAWSAGIAMIVLCAGIVAVHLQRKRLLPLIDRIWGLLPARIAQRIIHIEHMFLDDLATIGDVRVLLQAVVWSFYIWLIIACSFGVGFRMTGLEVAFLGGGVKVATLVALAVAAPAAPGFVGQFQFACRIALVDMEGVTKAAALGYSLLVHAVTFLTQVGVGVVYLLREGVSLGDIGRMAASEDADEGSA
jgi:uncharacterized protein (TIRG00374 family)